MKQDAILVQIATFREFRLKRTSIEMSFLHGCKFIDFLCEIDSIFVTNQLFMR